MRPRTAPVPPPASNVLRLACALACVLVLSASGCQPVAPATVVPHENPAAATSRYSPGTLFLYVSGALGQLALGEYESAQDMLANVDAQRAHIPEAVRRVCVRYVELCESLSRTLNDLDATLAGAEQSLAANETGPARERLDECRVLIGDAEEQLTALEEATSEAMGLVGRYGAGAARAAVEEAHTRLDDAIRRLRILTSEYLLRLAAAVTQLESRSVLERPVLTCSAGTDSVWVGEEIAVTGALSARGEPLAGRTVALLIDGATVGDAVTDGGGRFAVRVPAPYSYVPRLALAARFAPAGADLARCQAAESAPVVLTVRYHETVLDVDMPAKLHPGLPVVLTGRLRSLGALSGRSVQVFLGDVEIGQGASLSDGSLYCEVLTPPDAPEGEAVLVVRVEPVDGERTGPADAGASLTVSRVAPSVSLGIPAVVVVPRVRLLSGLLGQAGLGEDGLRVSVTLESALPLTAPAIVARAGDEVMRSTGSKGEQRVTFPLHPSVWTVGLQSARLDVVPVETWHRPVSREARFLVVNLIMVGLALAALVCVVAAMALLRRVAAVTGAAPGRTGIPAPAAVAGSAAPQESGAVSSRHAVVRLYLAAARRVESMTGFVFGRSVTLREFLTAVELLLGRAGRLFAGLTGLAEEALYSRREIDEKDAARSRELADRVQERARGDDERGEERP